MRMSVWKELKWLLASYLWFWSFRLTENEATPEMIEAYEALAKNFRNRAEHDTVRMRAKNR